MWNNGALDAAQTDGSLVYLYTHISQARALVSKAQGWETKSSYHSHTHTASLSDTHRHNRGLTLKGLFVQAAASQPGPP